MFQVHSTGFNSWTLSWQCDHCCATTWPVLRIAGYPTPEAWDMVDEGRAVLKGCCTDDEDDGFDYECPKCEKGVDVPMKYRDPDLF